MDRMINQTRLVYFIYFHKWGYLQGKGGIQEHWGTLGNLRHWLQFSSTVTERNELVKTIKQYWWLAILLLNQFLSPNEIKLIIKMHCRENVK